MLQVGATIEQTIADVITFLPTVIAALLVLIVGYVVGRIIGAIVTRVVRRIGIGDYTRGTAIEGEDTEDGVAQALGKIVAFYVYFVAILAAADILGISQVTEILTDLAAFLPAVLGAIVVLVIGFIVGRIVGDIVSDVVGGLNMGRYLRGTPLERLSDTRGEFGRLVGKLVTYYIYLLTLLAVADILSIRVLTDLLDTFASYLPELVGGLVVLLVGIWVAEKAAEVIRDSGTGRSMSVAAVVAKVFIYYVTITMVLDAIGFDVSVLTTLFNAFIVAFLGAFAVALAIGIGVAIGLGGQDFVAENIDGWFSSAKETVEEDGD